MIAGAYAKSGNPELVPPRWKRRERETNRETEDHDRNNVAIKFSVF